MRFSTPDHSGTPRLDDLDEEIRGHLAISVRERIDRGEDPDSARLAALKEFGNVRLTRDSMRGINDLKARVTSMSAFGDFSTIDFTMVGLGSDPRIVKAGVVSGTFFDVMGLRPVFGRLRSSRR